MTDITHDYQWTTEAVDELTKDWPWDARPRLSIAPLHGHFIHNGHSVDPINAARLHVESGLRWLAKRNMDTNIRWFQYGYGDGAEEEFVVGCEDDAWSGTTLLHAVDEAIRGVMGE